MAACAGVLDYFDALHAHHFGESEQPASARLAELYPLILEQENSIAAPILEFLDQHGDVRLIGKSHTRDNDRAPTIAFQPLKQSSESLTHRLQDAGIGAENGSFYAYRLVSDLGIDPNDGIVRLSLLHYSSADEVERILKALDAALN